MIWIRTAALAIVLVACGAPSTGVDAGDARDAQEDGASVDADVVDAGGPPCDMVPDVGEASVRLASVTLANFERDLLRLEAVTVGDVGSICISRGPPSAEILGVVEATVGAVYELRFTAEGYLPFTYRFEVTPESIPPAGFPGYGIAEPVVMVRGAVLGPIGATTVPLETFAAPNWGVRPGTDDLFYGVDDVWRRARRTGDTLTVTELDVAAPASDTLVHAPTFSPDGEIVLLVSNEPAAPFYSCSAVRAETGEVLARGLTRGLCMFAESAVFAVSAPVVIALDETTSELLVFEWDASGFREQQRLPYSGYFQRVLDAAGRHVLHEDDRGDPLIYDLGTGLDAAPTRVPFVPSLAFHRVLGADGTFTIHATSATAHTIGRTCGAGGCDIVIEPVGSPVRPIVSRAAAWAPSARVPAIVYVAETGELHHYLIPTGIDTVIAVEPFDATRTFSFEGAFVVSSATSLQIVDIATGEVRASVPGTFMLLEPEARESAGVAAAPRMLLRECFELDCEAWVLDLRAFTATRSHDHPFRGGERAWYDDGASSMGAGPSSQASGRYTFFAGMGSEMDEAALQPASAGFPCAPFRWRDQWICAL